MYGHYSCFDNLYNINNNICIMQEVSTNDITLNLKEAFYKSNFMVLKNVYLFNEESDILIISNKMYTHEIEIKVSRSDFRADFKKHKHEKINKLIRGIKLYNHKYPKANYSKIHFPERHGMQCKPINHISVDKYYSTIIPHEIKVNSLPNKFSFACPEGLIDENELPDHYGLYYMTNVGARLIKNPKFIHRQKFEGWKLLATKLYYNQQTYYN